MRVGPFKTIDRPRLLVGEGIEEVVVFDALLRHLGITDVQVAQYDGKAKLGTFLATLPRVPGFAGLRSLGITRDADDDPTAVLASIQSLRAAANLPPELRITVRVMPDAQTPGALETLCLRSIQDRPLHRCIEEFLSCAAHAHPLPPWSVGNAAKARVHAWLAVQSYPGWRLGEAAQNGVIDWTSAALAELRDFVAGL